MSIDPSANRAASAGQTKPPQTGFDWTSQGTEVLEQHFNPRLAVADADAEIARLMRLGAEARGRISGQLDLHYGPGAKETFDLFAPDAQAPVPAMIFIHGGYWRALDKADHSHLAPPQVADGIAHVSLNYDLCPGVTLDVIVDQMRAAMRYVHGHAAKLGLDASRLYLAGHSAGAHLAAMLLREDWVRHGLPAQPFAGAVLLSGIMDPRVVRRLAVNQLIGLSEATADRQNTLAGPPLCGCPQIVAVGALEPAGWRQQSIDYVVQSRDAGIVSDYVEVPDRQHFNLLESMADPSDALYRQVRRMILG